jgi:hypothetical protein
MRDNMEEQWITDWYERMQPMRPEVGENFVGPEIEQLWIFEEEDGTTILQWCQGIVIAVKTRDRAHIQWSEDAYLIVTCQLVRKY